MEDKLKKVVGSLEYGPLIRGWDLTARVVLIFCSVFFAALLLWLTLTEEMGAFFAIGFLAMVGCASVFLVDLIKNHRHLKAIRLWMQDAVPYTVFAEEAGRQYLVNGFGRYAARIVVRFSYHGREIVRLSGEGSKGPLTKEGFFPAWNKYCNREIDILYSPKYDQVIELKDPDR